MCSQRSTLARACKWDLCTEGVAHERLMVAFEMEGESGDCTFSTKA